MTDNIYTVEDLGNGTFRIDECGRDNCYLLCGSERALLIDCSIGTGDIAALVRTLTPLDVTVAVTHAHGDHSGAGYQFPALFVPRAECIRNYRLQNTRLIRRTLLSNRMKRAGITKKDIAGSNLRANWIPLDDGAVFELGGRTVRALCLPGHTVGSTVFLDETNRLLFTGDNACPVLPLHIYRCLPLECWIPSGETILGFAEKGYALFCGHGNGRMDPALLRRHLEDARALLKENPRNARRHKTASYPAFSKDGCICYDKANLYQKR